jgi:hypothetical protein
MVSNWQTMKTDPYESAEYQRFVESMVEHCHCHEGNRPCDGVLAGGLCDGIKGPGEDDYEDILREIINNILGGSGDYNGKPPL